MGLRAWSLENGERRRRMGEQIFSKTYSPFNQKPVARS